jgi:Fe2+ or Zn2+ uptake regulation protein
MAGHDQDIASRMAHFERACREAGAKLTHQRLEIFREVAKTGDHPDAETIHRRVRDRMPTVSLDTIYRTLWLLVDLGIVQTLGAGRERARFDANLDQHHHFVCVKCGLTRDFYSKEFDGLTRSPSSAGSRPPTWKCEASASRAPRRPFGPGPPPRPRPEPFDTVVGYRGKSHE